MNSRLIIDFYNAYRSNPGLYLFQGEDTDLLQEALDNVWGIPPEQALAYLKSKGGNLITTNRWDELDAEAHDKAFTVSKVASADLLQEIYNNVEKAKAKGWTLKQFQNELLPALEKSGWAGVTPGRLTVIYDTNMQMSFAKNEYKQMKLVSDKYPFWKYVQVERKTKRHSHTMLNGKVFRHDDPIWQRIYPPSDFGCKCSVYPLSKDEVDKFDVGSDIKGLDPNDFQISPLKAFEPDTKKYVNGIKSELEKMMRGAVNVSFNPKEYKRYSKTELLKLENDRENYQMGLDRNIQIANNRYTGSGYKLINYVLRNEKLITENKNGIPKKDWKKFEVTSLYEAQKLVHDTKQLIDSMNQDLKFKLPKNTQLFRGETYSFIPEHLLGIIAGKVKSFESNGYFSASYEEEIAKNFTSNDKNPVKIIYKIYSPKDTNTGVGTDFEKEAIIPHKQIFKVLNVSEEKHLQGKKQISVYTIEAILESQTE